MKITMPVVQAPTEITTLLHCIPYLAVNKDNGSRATVIRGDREILFFDENSHVTYLSPKDGTPNMEWLLKHYTIVRRYTTGDTLMVAQ